MSVEGHINTTPLLTVFSNLNFKLHLLFLLFVILFATYFLTNLRTSVQSV